ncbi:MAG TPA: molybdopterin-dependent oxidoreductase [Candidatus Acidoferrales bacterium]|nr:molybdopterin-dependent oxidoreductase [Candidatus Acidoferrales bacterium]
MSESDEREPLEPESSKPSEAEDLRATAPDAAAEARTDPARGAEATSGSGAEATPEASPAAEAMPEAANAPAKAGEPPVPAPARAPHRSWRDANPERPETVLELPLRRLRAQSRRDFLIFGLGAAVVAAGAWWLLPDRAKSRLFPGAIHDPLDTLAARAGLTGARREQLLDRALTFDDDVAAALYSKDRRVPTYHVSDIEPLRNNYHGRTPGPEILGAWALQLDGLASGATIRLTRDRLVSRFALVGQVTRLVCVEGWSAIAWWGGLRFADLLAAFPPAPGARWAALRSDASLDLAGRPEPYFVSLDLETARHPQTLLATHHNGQPLSLAHGAPLRLLVPVKLGLKNIKAITHITYTASEPPDYWNLRGYSKYDGL